MYLNNYDIKTEEYPLDNPELVSKTLKHEMENWNPVADDYMSNLANIVDLAKNFKIPAQVAFYILLIGGQGAHLAADLNDGSPQAFSYDIQGKALITLYLFSKLSKNPIPKTLTGTSLHPETWACATSAKVPEEISLKIGDDIPLPLIRYYQALDELKSFKRINRIESIKEKKKEIDQILLEIEEEGINQELILTDYEY